VPAIVVVPIVVVPITILGTLANTVVLVFWVCLVAMRLQLRLVAVEVK
jgi:hypothetical protein